MPWVHRFSKAPHSRLEEPRRLNRGNTGGKFWRWYFDFLFIWFRLYHPIICIIIKSKFTVAHFNLCVSLLYLSRILNFKHYVIRVIYHEMLCRKDHLLELILYLIVSTIYIWRECFYLLYDKNVPIIICPFYEQKHESFEIYHLLLYLSDRVDLPVSLAYCDI